LVLSANAAVADPRTANLVPVIEVFTSSEHPIIATGADSGSSHLRGLNISVHKIDGVQSVERDLSLNLPAEPQQAKQIALHRIETLDATTRESMHAAATALAKSMQYGLDRYPAIVFNGKAVVYGVTDLVAALDRYRVWQAGTQP
jgi:integrating conjugative element protein (TIGR03757 family)